MFSLTPIEAAMWHLGVAAQTQFAIKFFGSVAFTGIVVFFLMKKVQQVLAMPAKGADTTEVATQILNYGFCVAIGLIALRTVSTDNFSPVNFSGREWSSFSNISSSAGYKQLSKSTNGLYWYRLLHGATNETSKYLSKISSSIFSDGSYHKSPDLMFKVLTSTASVNLDDPLITAKLDDFVGKCSDTQNGAVLDEAGSIKDLLDMNRPECSAKYRELQAELKNWARVSMPKVLKKLQRSSSEDVHPGLIGLTDADLAENKVIGSALVNYAREKAASGKDTINTNIKELGIRTSSDHFWYSIQKITSSGGLATMFGAAFGGKGEAEVAINRNEARITYNNLLNLIPSFKGYVKFFIALLFLFAASGLCLGFTQPAVWWGKVILMDMVYEPLSTLNYELSSMMLASSNISEAFGHLSNDPMALMGAATIDSELVAFQTSYFLVQFVIAAIFVVGIIKSGFAIRSMSFAQGGGMTNIPGATTLSRSIGPGVHAIRSKIARFRA